MNSEPTQAEGAAAKGVLAEAAASSISGIGMYVQCIGWVDSVGSMDDGTAHHFTVNNMSTCIFSAVSESGRDRATGLRHYNAA